jgi:hypothetical protein
MNMVCDNDPKSIIKKILTAMSGFFILGHSESGTLWRLSREELILAFTDCSSQNHLDTKLDLTNLSLRFSKIDCLADLLSLSSTASIYSNQL